MALYSDHEVEVTKDLVRIRTTTYPVAQITAVSMNALEKKRTMRLFALFALAFLVACTPCPAPTEGDELCVFDGNVERKRAGTFDDNIFVCRSTGAAYIWHCGALDYGDNLWTLDFAWNGGRELGAVMRAGVDFSITSCGSAEGSGHCDAVCTIPEGAEQPLTFTQSSSDPGYWIAQGRGEGDGCALSFGNIRLRLR